MSSDLSSYIPRHTVDFNTWQEHKLDDPVYQGATNSQHAQMSEEVMVRLLFKVYELTHSFINLNLYRDT